MSFPETRMRRLRRTEPLRSLVRETALEPGDLIYPLFLCPGQGVRRPVASMPGVFNVSIDEALREAEEAASLGLGGLLLFGLPESKDEQPPAHGTRTASSSRASAPSGKLKPPKSSCLSPTSAFANTPATATAA